MAASTMYNGCKEGRVNLRNGIEVGILSMVGLMVTGDLGGYNVDIFLMLLVLLGVYDFLLRIGEYIARVVRPGSNQNRSNAQLPGQSRSATTSENPGSGQQRSAAQETG